MKFFIGLVLCITLAAVMADEIKDKIKAAHDKCQEDPSTHVDPAELEAFKKDQSTKPANLPAHTLCTSKHLGWQSADGKVDKDHLKERISVHVSDPAKVQALVDECAVDKATPEDTAADLFKCFYKNIHVVQH